MRKLIIGVIFDVASVAQMTRLELRCHLPRITSTKYQGLADHKSNLRLVIKVLISSCI